MTFLNENFWGIVLVLAIVIPPLIHEVSWRVRLWRYDHEAD